MNIYVDKLPDACAWCFFNDDYRCGVTGEMLDHTWGDGRLKSCPLRIVTDLAEVVRGEWVTDVYYSEDGEQDIPVTRCSQCGAAYEYGHDKPFCEMCGADMRTAKR